MNIIVSKDIVKLNENHSENHYGEYNVNECVFEFDEYFGSVPIKKAIFTSQSNNKSFEIDIINNKCTVPHEVLTKVYDTVILGVYGYDVNEETLLVRYSPEPTTFVVHAGSYKEGAEQPEIITPTQYDMFSKALQEGLAEVDKRLDDVEKQGDYASEQGNYAKEQGDYAKSEGDNAKSVAEETEKKAQEGAFDGKSLEFVWEGTKLGVRLESQEEYHFVDLQGKQGEIGATGEPFKIKKTYASVSEMNADFRNMEFGDYVMIASSVEVEDNAKLYTRGESAWIFISDFSGAMGIRGETGLTPNIKIGEVKTLEPGSQAKVTRSGSNEEPVFNFELPKGDKGDNYVLTEEDKVEIGKKVNTEYEERITENEKYISDLEATIDILTNTNTAKGELVHITDALPLPTFENKVDGNVEQETTEGYNLITTEYIPSTGFGTPNTKLLKSGTYTLSMCDKNPFEGPVYIKLWKNGEVITTSSHVTNVNNWNISGFSSITYNYYGSVTSTTNFISFNIDDDYELEITVLDASGTRQVTLVGGETPIYEYEKFTGGQASPNPEYPQEIEVLEGYNLIDKDNYILDTWDNKYDAFQVDLKAGTYTLSSNSVMATIKASNHIGTSWDSVPFGTSEKLKTFTFTINQDYKGGIVIRLDDGTQINHTNISNYDIQLIKGTNIKPYLSYGCVGYKVNGKNLAKSFKNTPATTQFYSTLYLDITFKPNTTYTFGFTTPENCKLYFNEKIFKYLAFTGTGKFQTYTVTTLESLPSSQYFNSLGWLTLKTNSGNTVESVITDVMLVEGTDLSIEYEPYKEQIFPLDLKGNWVGKVSDTIKDELYTKKKHLLLDKTLTKIVFNGSEDWRLYAGTTYLPEGTYVYVLDMYDCKLGFKTSICTHFTNQNFAWDKVYAKPGLYSDHLSVQTKFFVTDVPTVEEFKAYLKQEYDKGTPVTLIYELAEPQIIELGELEEPITTFEGVNNIQLLANLDTEIEVKYALDVKKYYDNKIASLSNEII